MGEFDEEAPKVDSHERAIRLPCNGRKENPCHAGDRDEREDRDKGRGIILEGYPRSPNLGSN
jgi:hypothetical protein